MRQLFVGRRKAYDIKRLAGSFLLIGIAFVRIYPRQIA